MYFEKALHKWNFNKTYENHWQILQNLQRNINGLIFLYVKNVLSSIQN